MALRFAAQCARCSAVTAAGQRAFWDADRRVVICLGCHDLSVGERSGATAFPAPVTYAAPLAPGDGDPEVRAPSPTEPPDGGTAGASAEAVWR
ncbi:MAG: hypothetical protein ACRDYZ_04600, partial [Acidimicrobiales bacterium]